MAKLKERTDEESAKVVKKYRVQLDYSPEDFDRINSLVDELGLGTRAELYRSALLALQWVITKKKEGCAIVAITSDGRYLEPEFSFVRNIAMSRAHAGVPGPGVYSAVE